MGVNLDNFAFPIDADVEMLKARQEQSLGNGVSVYSGQDRGVSFRFFIDAVYNKLKSDLTKTEQWDRKEMIQFFADKFSKPVHEVTPEIIARYPKEYEAWKRGLEAPGTPLCKWAACEVHQYKTLAGAGIFSVEQFAETPKGKISGRFAIDIQELHDRAIQYVNGQTGRISAEEHAEKLAEQARENAKLKARIDDLEKFVISQSGAKRGRKPSPEKAAARAAEEEAHSDLELDLEDA